eukprot:gene9066-9236_t
MTSSGSSGSPTDSSPKKDDTRSDQRNSNTESNQGAINSAATTTIGYCPPWAANAALASGSVALPRATGVAGDQAVPYTANYSSTGAAGITTSDRMAVEQAAAQDAIRAALGNRSDVPLVDPAPSMGLFRPLTSEEILAVYSYLYSDKGLNLTFIELAKNHDNYVAWLELAPPNKQAALQWLNGGSRSGKGGPAGQMPPRQALALVVQGRHNPPRVVQLRVGPLPEPNKWSYEPLGPWGQLEAGWLQRPYTIPEAISVGEVITAVGEQLAPLMKLHLDGFYFDAAGECKPKCLTFSLGAPFGSGPPQPPGAVIGSRQVPGGAGSASKNDLQQRWLWVFFYRDLEGHHLQSVGLEFRIDASDPSEAIFSTFVPRVLAHQDSSSSSSSPSSWMPGARPGSGPPLQYEPGGRRFKLGRTLAVEDWMGWSFSIGHRPTAGISFWDIRFKGERIVYELALQEAYAAYGGPTPLQSHTVYLDSHFGLGASYKELVAGVDCPLNAAFMDLTLAFFSGPVTFRNAICLFEVNTGRPLLRHYADSGGGAAYYGGILDTTLTVRAISVIYNYDYVQDLVLHLDGSIEVAAHTTGYPQSVWYSYTRHGNKYGYPFWYDNSGTIHDHQLHWKVDLDIAGTSNSVRMDKVLPRQHKPDNGLPGSGLPWWSKQLEQVFLETESQAALFWNGSSRADPDAKADVALMFIINEDAKNKWNSARGYRVQHIQGTPQILPADFNAVHGYSWTLYQTAVTRREESEPVSSSQLNQALPFAPAMDFQQLLSSASQVKQSAAATASHSHQADPGDPIRRQDVVVWITSGLQHIPGAEDAPVTPSTGPAIGFWLRPFNFFDENAAASQPDLVYIPALTTDQANASLLWAY